MVTRVPASRLEGELHRGVHAEHRALDGVAPRRLVRGDLEGQIELTIAAATLLPQSRAQPAPSHPEHIITEPGMGYRFEA